MHLRHERKAQWMIFERKQASQFWLHELIVHDAGLFGTLPASKVGLIECDWSDWDPRFSALDHDLAPGQFR
jgi:hypothetical protein